MSEIINIENCNDCPFSHWSDHACGHNKNGTVCEISDITLSFNVNKKNLVPDNCPLHKENYIKTYKLTSISTKAEEKE